MEDEHELVERARRGDRDAAAELLSRYGLVVHRTCRHLLPRGDDLEAAVQETFLRALRSLRSYSGNGSFAGWLATIAINLCRDRLRRHRLVPFLSLSPAGDGSGDGYDAVPGVEASPERVAMARQAVAQVQRELRRLPARQRETFVLRFFVGLELAAIAGALGIDVGTVKTHLHRAVTRVRKVVEEARP